MANSKNRNDNWEENAIEDEHNDSRRHHEHGPWVELPPGPILGVIASERRKAYIPVFILLAESLSAVPGELDGNKANKSLDN